MRILRALFAGFLGLAAFGGGLVHAQEATGDYWVNPAWSGSWRNEMALQQGAQPASTSTRDDLALGFTLNGFAGITGQLELGRVSLDPDSDQDRIATFGHSALGGAPVDQAVGEASLNWNVTDRLQLSTSYARGAADPTLFSGTPVFEDAISGGVTYAITPRFAVSARGSRRVGSDANAPEVEGFTGDGAELGAEYQFMPYFTGSVNYTYQSYDGQQGVLRHDESTLSLSLTGRF